MTVSLPKVPTELDQETGAGTVVKSQAATGALTLEKIFQNVTF